MKRRIVLYAAGAVCLAGLVPAAAQKIETAGGVRTVHNDKGTWGGSPRVALEPVRKIGDVDTADENLAFYMPADIALDAVGNMYIVDSGNHRIQKFAPDGTYLATLGRQGEGPGEFTYPQTVDITETGDVFVPDPQGNRIQVLTPEGRDRTTIKVPGENLGAVRRLGGGRMLMANRGGIMIRLGGQEDEAPPPLFKILDAAGGVAAQFGEPTAAGDVMLDRMVNQVEFTTDPGGRVYAVYVYQNRLEKYDADGRLLWRADRKLDYGTEIQDKGSMEARGGMQTIRMPRLNRCASGIAVDGKGRIWVVAQARQLREEEQVGTSMSVSMEGGRRSMSMKPTGNTDLRTTDAYVLEVYDSEGILLGRLPLDLFVDRIRVFGDRLFLIDRNRGASVSEYKIVER